MRLTIKSLNSHKRNHNRGIYNNIQYKPSTCNRISQESTVNITQQYNSTSSHSINIHKSMNNHLK